MKKNMTEFIIKELYYIYYILRPYQRIFLFLPSPSMFHYWHSLLPILQGKSMYRGPTKCAASANTYTWCCHRRLHQNKPSREYQVNNQIDNLLRQLLNAFRNWCHNSLLKMVKSINIPLERVKRTRNKHKTECKV